MTTTLSVDAPALLRALVRLRRVIPKSATGVFGSAHLTPTKDGIIVASAANGAMQLNIRLPGTLTDRMLIPAHQWSKLLDQMTGTMTAEHVGDKVQAQTASGLRFAAPWVDPATFPIIETEGPLIAGIDIDAEQFGWAIQKTMPAMSTDPGRPQINGVHLGWDKRAPFEGIRLVGTNGKRLVRAQLPDALNMGKLTGRKFDAIIPPDAVLLAEKLLLHTPDDLRLLVGQHGAKGKTRLSLDTHNWQLVVIPIAATYPNHLAVLPDVDGIKTRATIDAMGADGALDTLAPIKAKPGHDKIVKLECGGGKVAFSTVGVDDQGGVAEGGTTVDAEVTGKAIALSVPLALLQATLATIENTAVLAITNAETAVYVGDGDDPDHMQIIMPARNSSDVKALPKPDAKPKATKAKAKTETHAATATAA